MGLTLVTAPEGEPVTLQELKASAKIDIGERDAELALALFSAREWCEGYIGRRFITQTWDYSLDRFPPCIEIPTGPVQSVSSINYTDGNGTTQLLAAADYQVDTRSRVCRILPAYGKLWPITRDDLNAVVVRVVVGYGATTQQTPPDLRHAILLYARYLIDAEDQDRIAAERQARPLRVVY